MNNKVSKHVLSNGLTVLAVSQKIIPKVSIQLWYNVGSKDEKQSEKGIAHLIEHMIFKGTEKLSESDINLITHKLSGSCNAFTSHDYTGYMFDFPSQNWSEALNILADCMKNCTFKKEFLDSEFKAVIQELKMYKDDYVTSIIENMFPGIFYDHPYLHPIIGYKQDLWNLNRQELVNFYKKHYIPNNAALIVVGDVDAKEVFDLAEKAFGEILPELSYKKDKFYHTVDLRSTSVTLYRELKQPIILLAFVIPGIREKKDYLVEAFSWILGNGKGSRLYKKLVDEMQLLTELETFAYDLFEYSLFFIKLQPKKLDDLDKILGIIKSEIEDLALNGSTPAELKRAIKKTEVEYLHLMENTQKQAYGIGKYFLATSNENYIYEFVDYPKDNDLNEEIKQLAINYFRPSSMHIGKVLPVDSKEKPICKIIQDISDQEDAKVLRGRLREAEVEGGVAVNLIKSKEAKAFEFPKAEKFYLSNGLKVLYAYNDYLPKIDLILDFKAKFYYDPDVHQGIENFVFDMFLEGTEKYNATTFADILESNGMLFSATNGQIKMSMLQDDLEKGLELLNEILCKLSIEETAVEKIRAQILSDIDNYWDSPTEFFSQIARETVYKDHPFSKSPIGSDKSISYISRDDLKSYYKKYISPKGARLSVVGNVDIKNLKQNLEKYLGSWIGQEIPDLNFVKLDFVKKKEINYPIVRDQVVLGYVGLSVDRRSPEYDKLLLFDQIFGGGVLGSMSSRLFDLRERTGLFYTISGSVINKATKQPGMIVIKTLVSNDSLADAQKVIENAIDTVADTLEPQELIDAKNALINSLVDNFATSLNIAQAILAQDFYDFPDNYFDIRAQELSSISLEQVQHVVKKYLSNDKLAKIRIGRVI